jgi:hypothetical protein
MYPAFDWIVVLRPSWVLSNIPVFRDKIANVGGKSEAVWKRVN